MTITQMRIHLRLQTSVDRCLQQALDQLACIIGERRQLADHAGELRIIHQLLADLVAPRQVMVFINDTVVIISKVPSRSERHTQAP